MSDSVRPHRRQPTRLPHPWDSPGKNTGVGCHFLLQCVKVKVKSLSRVQFFATPGTAAYQAPPPMGFSRQEYWSGVPLPSPGYLPRRLKSENLGLGPGLKVEVKSLSHVRLFAIPWTVAYQAPQSVEFSRQGYWSELPFPSPEDLPNPGIEPGSPALQADALPSEPPGIRWF